MAVLLWVEEVMPDSTEESKAPSRGLVDQFSLTLAAARQRDFSYICGSVFEDKVLFVFCKYHHV